MATTGSRSSQSMLEQGFHDSEHAHGTSHTAIVKGCPIHHFQISRDVFLGHTSGFSNKQQIHKLSGKNPDQGHLVHLTKLSSTARFGHEFFDRYRIEVIGALNRRW